MEYNGIQRQVNLACRRFPTICLELRRQSGLWDTWRLLVWMEGRRTAEVKLKRHEIAHRLTLCSRAMDSTSLVSNNLKTQSVAEANKCAIKSTVNEDIDGCKLLPLKAPTVRASADHVVQG